MALELLKETASFKKGWKSLAFYGMLGLGAYKLGSHIYKKKNQKSFSGDIVLVTGGAQGLGKCLCEVFLKEGCVVVIWDINENTGKETVEQFSDEYGDGCAYFYKVNVASFEEVKKFGEIVKEEVGPVDVLVNNAGIVGKTTIYKQSIESMERIMDVNVRAHFYTVKVFLDDMLERKKGHIVNIGSVASLGGSPNMAVYCASKMAVFGFTESLRLQFLKDKQDVDVLLVMPFYMKGPMFDGVDNGLIPLLDPKDVAKRVLVSMKDKDPELLMPFYMRQINHVTRGFFWRHGDFVLKTLGILESMDEVVKE